MRPSSHSRGAGEIIDVSIPLDPRDLLIEFNQGHPLVGKTVHQSRIMSARVHYAWEAYDGNR